MEPAHRAIGRERDAFARRQGRGLSELERNSSLKPGRMAFGQLQFLDGDRAIAPRSTVSQTFSIGFVGRDPPGQQLTWNSKRQTGSCLFSSEVRIVSPDRSRLLQTRWNFAVRVTPIARKYIHALIAGFVADLLPFSPAF